MLVYCCPVACGACSALCQQWFNVSRLLRALCWCEPCPTLLMVPPTMMSPVIPCHFRYAIACMCSSVHLTAAVAAAARKDFWTRYLKSLYVCRQLPAWLRNDKFWLAIKKWIWRGLILFVIKRGRKIHLKLKKMTSLYKIPQVALLLLKECNYHFTNWQLHRKMTCGA